MRCPFCKAEDTKVVDSRVVRDQSAVRRRRRCGACEQRFTTYERVEMVLPTVIKRDGSRQPFDSGKIRAGLEQACHKRKVPAEALDTLIHDLERSFAERADREVVSTRIGDEVLRLLRALDEVAYVRFASVYREFGDVRQFLEVLDGLHAGSTHKP